MKKNRILTNSLRVIKLSFPRFLSLTVISMLGVFCFAGLGATAPDMIKTLDNYLDSPEEVFIIGGASIYKQFIKYATRLYLTEIDESCHLADVYFPEFNKRNWSREIITSGEWENIKLTMCKYTKNKSMK